MTKYLLTLLFLCVSLASAQETSSRYPKRWIYAQYNLLVEKNVDQVLSLIERGQKSGYNGMVLADYKFNILERLPASYFKNVARVKKAADAAGIELIPTVCPIGYSAGLLAHDPNLAEGIPVKDAPFVVQNGQATLSSDGTGSLQNGDLEKVKGDRFLGFTFQDNPGKTTFADHDVVHGGKTSVRMEKMGDTPAGNCRLSQRLKVRPFACYRLSAWVKTRDLKPSGGFRLLALGTSQSNQALTHFEERLEPTQDWKRYEVVFNTLAENEITAYAGIWSGKAGTLWIDDIRLEELALVNVLRRDGCPLTVTSEDGKITYEEGKDFQPVRDAKLGQDPWAGEYSFKHAGPSLRLTEKSRIQEGEKLRVSWYHPLVIHGFQVASCLSEPKVYDILRDQVQRVDTLLKPKTFFMSHDEIRVANWCQLCRDRQLTPGAMLADNVRRCLKIIKDVSPDAQIIVWSDMFDPNHNAVEHYYQVNGPWAGSWDGLPASVAIANWNSGKAPASLKWFAQRGHAQILAGYYDSNLEHFRRWDTAARDVRGVIGFMYTTWQHKYDHLEAYGKALQGKE